MPDDNRQMSHDAPQILPGLGECRSTRDRCQAVCDGCRASRCRCCQHFPSVARHAENVGRSLARCRTSRREYCQHFANAVRHLEGVARHHNYARPITVAFGEIEVYPVATAVGTNSAASTPDLRHSSKRSNLINRLNHGIRAGERNLVSRARQNTQLRTGQRSM